MALRSVVLAPPPGAGGPRKTVVLRPGGPKDKGKAADIVTGVVGAMLLLACIFLAQWLPDKEYALPQFQVTFPEAQINNTSQKFAFTEQERDHEFVYELPDNAFSVTLVLNYVDDMEASLQDQFRIELFDPQGTPVGPRSDLFSPLPVEGPGFPPTYTAPTDSTRLTIPIGLLPSTEIVQGLSHLEVAEQVRARIEPQHYLPTAGTWTVRVSLINAGDCPASPGASDTQPGQFFACRQEAPQDGSDPGNEFTIETVVINTYSVKVEQLS